MFWSRNNSPSDPTLTAAFGVTLDAAERETLQKLSTLVSVTEGTVLTAEGSIGSEALFIAEGTAVVSRDGEVLATISAGEVIGEMALLSGERRNATVVAASDMKLYALSRQEFTSLLDACPRIGNSVATMAVRRLASV